MKGHSSVATPEEMPTAFSLEKWLTPSRSFVLPNLLLLFFWALAFFQPLKYGISFGGDEGMEIQKALLLTKGYSLYDQIWSDQPPFYTYILALLIEIGGANSFLPRVFSVLCASIAVWVICYLTQKEAGILAGLAAATAFISVPPVTGLSYAIMQEIPMVSFSLAACATAFSGNHVLRRWITPVLIVLAISIKLTAILFLPAILVALTLNRLQETKNDSRTALKEVLCFFGISGTFGVLCVFLFGFGSLDQIFRTHFGFTDSNSEAANDLTITMRRDILPSIDLFIGASIGLFTTWRSMTRPFKFFCYALVFGQALFCLFHRPWWPFYLVGVSVPLCLFHALGIAAMLRGTVFTSSRDTTVRGLCITALGALVLVYSLFFWLYRFHDNYTGLQKMADIRKDGAVQFLARSGDTNQFIYSQDEMVAYHAGYSLAPELAVTSLKRLWSGQFDTNQVPRILAKYGISLALLRNETMPSLGERLIAKGFANAYQDNSYTILQKTNVNLSTP
ncbi:MAG: glycosyltransferase family 39 protein [Verrucomicrobiota bacterium]|nr:glycosyltransferase family 39 protein [Verrucomicrobiota bacterium]